MVDMSGWIMSEHGIPDSRLSVIERCGTYISPNGTKEPLWLCKCNCNKRSLLKLRSSQIKNGKTKSCGCLKEEMFTNIITKHGFGDEENIYKHWLNMRNRCNNPNYEHYNVYGGRGIKICNEWNDYAQFRKWSLDNGYKSGLTLDRINVDCDYTPKNCRWETWKVQQNNKRNNHYITYNNVTHTMKEWSEIRNINYSTLRNRINQYGWSIGRALEYEQ